MKNISLESTLEVFSSHSGLFLFENLWKSFNLEKEIKKLLPRKQRNKGPNQIHKIKSLIYSFAVGNDCLSDLDDLRNDQFFGELTNGGVASRTMGDFLRNFGNRHIERFQDYLIELALELRLRIFPNDKKFILAMDSTPHEHYSQKMEGLGFNYKNQWCIDSQNAYDQYGLSYLFDLRPGGTFSGNDAELWIHRIFSKVPAHFERWFRADSAYGKHEVFEALNTKNVKFAIVLKDNIGRYVRKKNINFLKWQKTKINFFDSDACEIAMGLYPIKELGTLRVVFIRAPRKDQPNLFDDPSEQRFQHYSIITNTNSVELSNEDVIEFYRGRANAENYIREQKYGFDFLNFPCKKLKANKVFGIVGTITHNLMRFLSLAMEQKIKRVRGKDKKVRTVTQLGYFSKRVRTTLINIPCRLVRSARKIKLRLNYREKEVIEKVYEHIQLLVQSTSLLQTRT